MTDRFKGGHAIDWATSRSWRQESESEKIIYLDVKESLICSRALMIAQISAVNNEITVSDGKTTAHEGSIQQLITPLLYNTTELRMSEYTNSSHTEFEYPPSRCMNGSDECDRCGHNKTMIVTGCYPEAHPSLASGNQKMWIPPGL